METIISIKKESAGLREQSIPVIEIIAVCAVKLLRDKIINKFTGNNMTGYHLGYTRHKR